MTFSLGIDLGTTTCTVARRTGSGIEICRLEPDATALPAVALAGEGGQLLIGRDADRRAPYEPALVARYVQDRLGGPTPIEVNGHPLDPRPLAAALFRAAAERAAPRPGATPESVVATFPLAPDPAPEALTTAAAIDALGPGVTLVPAPVAALAHAVTTHDLAPDALVAVVDVGGTTVDVALLRRTPTAFDLVGDPGRLGDLGGVDLDAAVVALVEEAMGDVTSMVDRHDRAGLLALRQLRAACRAAKEQLSTHATATIDVALPHARGRVEVTRSAYERTIEPALTEIADLVAATAAGRGLVPADLEAIVLVGGSARTPRIGEVLAERLGRPVLRDDEPEAAVARGAALFADVPESVEAVDVVDLTATAAPAPPVSALPGPVGLDDPVVTAPPGAGLAALPGLAGLADLPPVGPTSGERPLPWQSDTPPGDDEWDPPDALPAPTHAAALTGPPGDGWGQTSHDQAQQLTTSDTDPFGNRSADVLASLRRERQTAAAAEGDSDDGSVDNRLLLAGAAAAILVFIAGCWLALAGLGGNGTANITVADANSLRSATSTTDAPSTSTAEATTTTHPSTTTTEAPTTTAEESQPTTTPAPAPAPAPAPPTTPITTPSTTTTAPPRPTTTRPPTTTTTQPTTTTTTQPTTTTTTAGNGNGNGGGNGGGGG